MKTGIIVVLAWLSCVSGLLAMDWELCLEYLYPDVDPETSLELVDFPAKGVTITKWNLCAPQPTEKQLAAVEKDALAWKAEQRKLALADYEKWDVAELRVLVKALLAEVNELRGKVGLTALTPDDLKGRLLNHADAEEAK